MSSRFLPRSIQTTPSSSRASSSPPRRWCNWGSLRRPRQDSASISNGIRPVRTPARPVCAGEAFYLAGKLDQAKAELRAFVEKYPADDLNAYALPYLGDIALAQKDIAAAENYFRQGLSRFPQGHARMTAALGSGERWRSKIRTKRRKDSTWRWRPRPASHWRQTCSSAWRRAVRDGQVPRGD